MINFLKRLWRQSDRFRWIKRKPIRRAIAKARLRWLIGKLIYLKEKWQFQHTNQHLAELDLLNAKVVYYWRQFSAWGAYRPEFCFDWEQLREYEDEMDDMFKFYKTCILRNRDTKRIKKGKKKHEIR